MSCTPNILIVYTDFGFLLKGLFHIFIRTICQLFCFVLNAYISLFVIFHIYFIAHKSGTPSQGFEQQQKVAYLQQEAFFHH